MEASWALLNPQLLTHCDIWQSWHYTFDYWVLIVFHDYTLVINASCFILAHCKLIGCLHKGRTKGF